MQRFFVPELLPAVGEVTSVASIHHQLRTVLRAQTGTQFVLLDNQGGERLMEVVSVERRDTSARVVELLAAPPEPAVALTLYQCVLKSDKLEWVWQKATELGVTTLVPVISKRTIARPGRLLQSKQARWEKIIREAAEQCGRGRFPTVMPAVSFDEALTTSQGIRLLPWEEGENRPGLLQSLSQAPQPIDSVSLFIGPEGGFEAEEVEQASEAGWQVVSLGQRILRAETAAIASLAVISAALGELGDEPLVKVADSDKTSEQNGERQEQESESKEGRREKKTGRAKGRAQESGADAKMPTESHHAEDKGPHDKAV